MVYVTLPLVLIVKVLPEADVGSTISASAERESIFLLVCASSPVVPLILVFSVYKQTLILLYNVSRALRYSHKHGRRAWFG